MNYPRYKDGKIDFKYGRLIVITLLILVIIQFRGPIASYVEPILSRVAIPFWKLRNLLIADQFENAVKEIELLKEFRIKELEAELDIKDTFPTHILSSLSVSPYGTILIDRGSKDGLGLGDMVLTPEGVLLGDVAELYAGSAKVSLYSVFDRNSEVVSSEGTRFIFKGAGNQNFEARLPNGLELKDGEYLFVPGKAHYVLAKIERVDSPTGAAFQKIYARSPQNIHTVSVVYVKTKNE